MTEPMNRAQRRALDRAEGARRRRLKKGIAAVGAVAALGAGAAMAPAGHAFAETSTSAIAGLGDLDPNAILGMLDDPMVSQFVEMCRTGALATGPDSSKSTEFDPAAPPQAIADCKGSNGTGVALVLPETLEVGQAAENMVLDLGDDINLLVVKYRMGERNLLEILGGVTLGSDLVKGAASALGMPRVDPGAFDKYKTYAEIQRDAALPVNRAAKDGCLQNDGSIKNTVLGGCFFVGGTKVTKGEDLNLEKRTEALKLAEYLTNHKYDYTQPQDLPAPVKPIGSSTIVGDGINVALSMRGGTALAQTANALAVALAGADHGRTSTAQSQLGLASAVNMDTSDIKFTWFGQELDFTQLRNAGLLDSSLAGEAGADAAGMLDLVDGINGNLPGLKEVACFGFQTRATAEGLGSCTNALGTFDYYKDLRPVTDGGHRQEQWGLTDVTSLLFGNDALLKQMAPLLSGDGDLGSMMDTPFVADVLKALMSGEDRIKFAKDFVRFTKDVQTVYAKEPVFEADGVTPKLDADGKQVMRVKTAPRMVGVYEWVNEEYQAPVVDENGAPVIDEETGEQKTETKTRSVKKPKLGPDGKQLMEQATDESGAPILDPVVERTVTAHWLTSDYGLRNPITVEWLGHQIVFFPPVEVNGSTRPNLIGLPQITRITQGAHAGLLPKISLVQVNNPFGLGTLSFDNPFDPIGTLRNYLNTVTIGDDVKFAKNLIDGLTAKPTGPTEPGSPVEPTQDDDTATLAAVTASAPERALDDAVVGDPSTNLPPMIVNPAPEPAPIEIVEPAPSQETPTQDSPSEEPDTETPASETPASDQPAPETSATEPEPALAG
ncbi:MULTISPECIES: hypothetical protein [Gordonia]|nr:MULTISPECIES: hypothetical protein [Gordonia]